MIKISCYKTLQTHLSKAFCQLAEKCYYSKLKTTVITENDDFTQNLDRVLWTYSKKHFIPHATDSDPLPEKQPVYITSNIASSMQAEVIIFVNVTNQPLLESLAEKHKTQLKNVQKILFLFDETQKIQIAEINDLLTKSSIQNFSVSSFVQTKQGSWKEIAILEL